MLNIVTSLFDCNQEQGTLTHAAFYGLAGNDRLEAEQAILYMLMHVFNSTQYVVKLFSSMNDYLRLCMRVCSYDVIL